MKTEIPLCKYVMLDGDLPITFHPSIQHTDSVPVGRKAVSAGFFILINGKVSVYECGSETLRLNPRPQDQAILQRFLFS